MSLGCTFKENIKTNQSTSSFSKYHSNATDDLIFIIMRRSSLILYIYILTLTIYYVLNYYDIVI